MSVFDSKMQLRQEMYELEQRFKSNIKIVQQKLLDLQSICTHNWEYFSDPSGNNDSCYMCVECDKEVRRIK